MGSVWRGSEVRERKDVRIGVGGRIKHAAINQAGLTVSVFLVDEVTGIIM